MRPLLSNIPPLNVTLLFEYFVLCETNQAKEIGSIGPLAYRLIIFLRVEIRAPLSFAFRKVCFYVKDSILNFGFIMKFPVNILKLDF